MDGGKELAVHTQAKHILNGMKFSAESTHLMLPYRQPIVFLFGSITIMMLVCFRPGVQGTVAVLREEDFIIAQTIQYLYCHSIIKTALIKQWIMGILYCVNESVRTQHQSQCPVAWDPPAVVALTTPTGYSLAILKWLRLSSLLHWCASSCCMCMGRQCTRGA